MARPPLEGTVLITGASSGIGREMARQLAPRAKGLLLVARRADRLQALADELRATRASLQVSVHACDLADPVGVEGLLRTAGTGEPIDVLINNAGIGDIARLQEASLAKLQHMLQLNIMALTRLSFGLLPAMLARGRGGILNVGSALGQTFIPGMAAYGGSKHYVSAFTEALRLELRGTGVVVSQLCPGPVRTEFMDVAGEGSFAVPRSLTLSAERCARVALRGFERGRAMIVPGLLINIGLALASVTPRPILRLVYAAVARLLRRLPPPA